MKCILHIGTEKTGTTSIQDFLYANEGCLHRVKLFHNIGAPSNRDFAAYFTDDISDDYFVDRGIFDDAGRDMLFSNFESAFDEEIEECRSWAETCVITSEHLSSRVFSGVGISRVKEFLSKRFEEVEIVCYVRDQGDMRESAYSTAVTLHYTLDISEFLRDEDESSLYFNHYEMISRWAYWFGKQNIRVFEFCPQMFPDSDVRRHFARHVLGDVAGLDFRSHNRNESLTVLQAVALRAIHRHLRPGSREAEAELVEMVFDADCLALSKRISDREKRFFSRRFCKSNSSLFREYFGENRRFFRTYEEGGAYEVDSAETCDVEYLVRVLFDKFCQSFARHWGTPSPAVPVDIDAGILRRQAMNEVTPNKCQNRTDAA